MPYKGAVLAQMLYGDVAARQFGDLDLLVRRRDVAAGKSALQEIGYTCALQLSEDEERAYVRSGYEYVFDRGCEKNLIELHWRIVPRFYAVEFDIDALFERSVAVQLAGRSVATLGPEDLLLVLCVHAAKHGWTKLSWLSDLVALGETVDWTVVNERAKRLGIQRIVGISFALAKMLSCGSLHIEDKEAVAIASELETFMRAGMEIDVGAADYFRLMMRVRERWWDRVRFLSRLAFTPGVREWRSVRLPGSLFPAYRLVRMWRLVSKAAV